MRSLRGSRRCSRANPLHVADLRQKVVVFTDSGTLHPKYRASRQELPTSLLWLVAWHCWQVEEATVEDVKLQEGSVMETAVEQVPSVTCNRKFGFGPALRPLLDAERLLYGLAFNPGEP